MAEHPPPTPRPRFPDWRNVYQSVLQEADNKALFKQIEIAEAIILTRRDGLIERSDYQVELHALEEALLKLRTLKKDRLKFICD